TREGISARALEFAILTAARTGEVLGTRWCEIDLDRKIWIVPEVRMKAGREHRVPLSDAALSLLRSMRQHRREDDFVFPGPKVGRALSNMALLSVLGRLGCDELTVHGFRSTFRTWAAEATDFPHEVAEAALAHVVGNKVEAAYMRST